jgi:hypothetical protein
LHPTGQTYQNPSNATLLMAASIIATVSTGAVFKQRPHRLDSHPGLFAKLVRIENPALMWTFHGCNVCLCNVG